MNDKQLKELELWAEEGLKLGETEAIFKLTGIYILFGLLIATVLTVLGSVAFFTENMVKFLGG